MIGAAPGLRASARRALDPSMRRSVASDACVSPPTEAKTRSDTRPSGSNPRPDDRPPEAAVGQLKADDRIVEIDRIQDLIGGIVADRKNDQSVFRHVAARLAQIGFV